MPHILKNKIKTILFVLISITSLLLAIFLPLNWELIRSSINEEPELKNKLYFDSNTSTQQVLNAQDQLKTEGPYLVTKVVDGDTIKVLIDGEAQPIRLIGIDTPESVHPSKPVECFGIEASNKLKALLNNNKVILKTDSSQEDQDKYNRLLRYIFLEDGTNINLQMISDGYAFEYTYNIPYFYQQVFKNAETHARQNELGLWNEDTCNGELKIDTDTEIDIEKETETEIETTSTTSSSFTTSTTSLNSNTDSTNSSSNYICDCSKTCSQITSCEEAMYLLNTCGCTARDGDSDGIPCENLCP